MIERKCQTLIPIVTLRFFSLWLCVDNTSFNMHNTVSFLSPTILYFCYILGKSFILKTDLKQKIENLRPK